MKSKELRIVGLSYSKTQSGQFILVLGQKRGSLKLPIIIKEHEAQYIALKLENIKTNKTPIFDMIKNITDSLNADIFQVTITHVLEGVFHTKVSMSNMVDEFEFSCSVGDAICLSLAHGCPIYCSSEVLNLTGILMDDEGNIDEEQHQKNIKQDRDYKSVLSITDLEKLLDKAIENEEYEIASQIRDRITELKENTK
jgi:bifunctional DNase/RNase